MPTDSASQGMSTPEHATHAHTGAWVAGVLRARIADGQLLPGAKLSEQALSESLSVSRNTLREAFTVLAGEAVVTRIPNRGVFVASPGPEEIREIYRVRRMIEPAAALWSTDLDLEGLEGIVGQARAAKASGDVVAMANANQEFHQALVRASGSVQLQGLMRQVLAQMRLVFHAMVDAPDFHTHYVEPNAEFVSMLRAGDRRGAAEHLRAYLDRAEAELLGHLAARARP
ncbi:GntR family transcriptional regulator [Zafaria cholistanensis]|uniref:GntR family transcriptional regulator n=1 Tax=Zafaria cholistanensis TaxID=1682741 RepID=A0A5A7NNV8_9MICC|nr:GntR family transcriptional regulator [Zafaria cholistanensis]GER22604.1 GntR family transcriptional regulator [Zafaria cholistanensis]